MKRVRISILLLTLLPLAVGALPVRYSYDAAGNRVKREIVMNPSLSPKKQTSYTDDIADDYKLKITHMYRNHVFIQSQDMLIISGRLGCFLAIPI